VATRLAWVGEIWPLQSHVAAATPIISVCLRSERFMGFLRSELPAEARREK
jgi:hypothetical protein